LTIHSTSRVARAARRGRYARKMPELPEVETVLRTLEPRLPGRRVIEARFYSSLVMRGDAAETSKRIRAG